MATRKHSQAASAWVSLMLVGFVFFVMLAAIQPRELPRLPILYTFVAFGCMFASWVFFARRGSQTATGRVPRSA